MNVSRFREQQIPSRIARAAAAITITLALMAAVACGGDKQKQRSAQPEIVPDVPVVQVQRAVVPDYVEAVGTVRAARTAQLSAQVVATVLSVRAVEGQRVRKGDVLVVLDDAQQRAALERAQAAVAASQQGISAAEADYSLAQATMTRYEELYEKKSVSPHEFDEVQARYKAATARREAARAGQGQARAAAAEAQTLLGYTRVRAPFDGVVTAKQVDAGALAAPGVPLLTVEDTRRFRLEVTVDEGQIEVVKLGAAPPVMVDALGAEMTGKLVQVVPAADPASRSFLVKVGLPSDPRLRSGLFGRVRFLSGERTTVMVPRTAVLDRGQIQAVYVVGKDGEVAIRYVTLGRESGDRVEVLSGLAVGERLVAEHRGRELAGKRIVN